MSADSHPRQSWRTLPLHYWSIEATFLALAFAFGWAVGGAVGVAPWLAGLIVSGCALACELRRLKREGSLHV